MAKTYVVERSKTINASAEKLFAQVANLRNWSGWSPWDKRDLKMTKTYEGEDGTVGSSYGWLGNNKVGQGTMTIAKLEAPSAVTIDLNFVKPFKSQSSSRLTLMPEGKGTRVTWTMTGQHNWMSKIMRIFMSMDKMIGKDFEEGLNNLKTLSES